MRSKAIFQRYLLVDRGRLLPGVLLLLLLLFSFCSLGLQRGLDLGELGASQFRLHCQPELPPLPRLADHEVPDGPLDAVESELAFVVVKNTGELIRSENSVFVK